MRFVFAVTTAAGIFSATAAVARARNPVPLLPPRPASIDEASVVATSRPTEFNLFSFGAEAGVMGRQSSVAADGTQSYLGGRAIAIFGILPSLSLKTTAGFFAQAGSTVYVPTMDYVVEGGAIVQYHVVARSGFDWWAGASQRVDYVVGSRTTGKSTTVLTSAPTSSATNEGLHYRIGPATGVSFRLQPELDLTTEIEVTFPVTGNPQTYGGFSTGLVYHLF